MKVIKSYERGTDALDLIETKDGKRGIVWTFGHGEYVDELTSGFEYSYCAERLAEFNAANIELEDQLDAWPTEHAPENWCSCQTPKMAKVILAEIREALGLPDYGHIRNPGNHPGGNVWWVCL